MFHPTNEINLHLNGIEMNIRDNSVYLKAKINNYEKSEKMLFISHSYHSWL